MKELGKCGSGELQKVVYTEERGGQAWICG